jgi:hypothetical protein
MISIFGIWNSNSGRTFSFEVRLPPPRITKGRRITSPSIHNGRSFGRARAVTPPIFIPVTALGSSALAKDTLRAPIFFLTA